MIWTWAPGIAAPDGIDHSAGNQASLRMKPRAGEEHGEECQQGKLEEKPGSRREWVAVPACLGSNRDLRWAERAELCHNFLQRHISSRKVHEQVTLLSLLPHTAPRGLAGLSAICHFQNLREADDRPTPRLSNATYGCQGQDREKNRFFKGISCHRRSFTHALRLFVSLRRHSAFFRKATVCVT